MISPGLLPGDDIMLFIFARQVRDMRLGIVMIVVTTSELNSAHNGGECQPAVTGHCEIQRLKYTIKCDPDTRGRGDVIKFAYNLFPTSPCY